MNSNKPSSTPPETAATGATLVTDLAADLAAAAHARFARAPFCLAFSGGGDSTALLHLLCRAGLAELRAVHVDHGLQPAAVAWREHCARLCAQWGVPLRILSVDIQAGDPAGPEAAARAARYAALQAELRPGEVLVTAHHQDDQAETVLLRLLRGAGLEGWAAIPEQRPFAAGTLWRPLLEVSRSRLRAYAQAQGLVWVEDPHNTDPRFDRSWLRQQLLPLLRQRWPQADAALARAARWAGEAAALLEDYTAETLRACCDDAQGAHAGHGESGALRIAALLQCSAAQRRAVLRLWLRRQGMVHAPSASALARIEREVIAAAADAQPLWRCGGYEVRRYRGRLYALPALPPPPGETELLWTQSACPLPPGCGRLIAQTPPPMPLRVRFPRGGEALRPAGAPHRRSLKNLFQEAGIPPWRRLRTPLLYAGEELVAVAGYWRIQEWMAENRGWSYAWEGAEDVARQPAASSRG